MPITLEALKSVEYSELLPNTADAYCPATHAVMLPDEDDELDEDELLEELEDELLEEKLVEEPEEEVVEEQTSFTASIPG